MRVLVCGGRNYRDVKSVFTALDDLDPRPSLVIHGGANGADACAGEWARKRSVECKVYHADWHKHGRAAGPIRNQKMLEHGSPDVVIAFPGGSGTADMMRRAHEAGIIVVEVK